MVKVKVKVKVKIKVEVKAKRIYLSCTLALDLQYWIATNHLERVSIINPLPASVPSYSIALPLHFLSDEVNEVPPPLP